MGAAFSDIIFAVRGIVAGSGLATTEMRLVMVDIVDAALTVHPDVEPTLFVDDLSVETDGDDYFLHRHPPRRLHQDSR